MKYFAAALLFLTLSAQADVLKCEISSWDSRTIKMVQYGELVIDSNSRPTPQLDHCPASINFMTNDQLRTTTIGIGTMEGGFFKNFAQFEYPTGHAPSKFRLSATFPEAGALNVYIADCIKL